MMRLRLGAKCHRGLGVPVSPGAQLTGLRLALATAATDQRGGTALRLLTRDGAVTAVIGLGPDGGVDAPQWLPGGEALLLTAYPQGGRRIVAVTAATGSVADLTHPRWDAFGSLRPDGGAVLLLWLTLFLTRIRPWLAAWLGGLLGVTIQERFRGHWSVATPGRLGAGLLVTLADIIFLLLGTMGPFVLVLTALLLGGMV